MKEIEIVSMSASDIALGMELKELAGWNQTAEDWEFMISQNRGGHFVALCEEERVGTVTSLLYESGDSWIGMVLVKPSFRGHGIGTLLLNTAIDFGKRHRKVGLDATPQGEKLYGFLGFEGKERLWRMERTGSPFRYEGTSLFCSQIPVEMLDRIVDFDKNVFGADRRPVLEYLYQNRREYAFYYEEDGNIKGFCMGRKGSNFEHIGPVVAERSEIAQALILRVLEKIGQKSTIIDVFEKKGELPSFLESLGFVKKRPFLRMYLGGMLNNHLSYHAIAGPELG